MESPGESVKVRSKQTLSPSQTWISSGPTNTPLLTKFVTPPVGGEGLLFEQPATLMISN